MPRRPRVPLIEGFPTHVVRDTDGGWHAVGFEEAAERRDQGWRVVRIVDAANAKHPVQVRILARLEEVSEASSRELAERLGLPLPNVAYHVRSLAKQALIVLSREEQVRGSVARYYTLPGRLLTLRPGHEELWCAAGHHWQRPTAPGPKPVCCPLHSSSS